MQSVLESPRDHARLPEGCHDVALEGLPDAWRTQLEALDTEWLASLDFSTCFFARAHCATRAFSRVDAEGRITRAAFYAETRWLRWRQLELFGPVDITEDEIRWLLEQRGAHLAVIHRMDRDRTRSWRVRPHRVRVARMSEDYVIDLPDTPEAYVASLGPSTRKKMPYAFRRIEREVGKGLRYITAWKTDIDYAHYRALIELNRLRIEGKGLAHGWNDELIAQRWRLVQRQGLFCGIFDGDKLLGGAINYIHHRTGIMGFVGHDPALNHAQVGHAYSYLSISEMIGLGLPKCQLLWGYSLAKILIGGHTVPFFDVLIFRTPPVALAWHILQGPSNLLYQWRTRFREAIPPAKIEEMRKFLRRFPRKPHRPAGCHE